MLLTNTDFVPGKEIVEVKGLVKGTCVQARWVGKDIRAAGRTLIGGEMKYYTELLTNSRNRATKRMMQEASKLGANAVINIRYNTAAVAQGSAEVLAYGTAVILK
ncbi:MAG: YbjQ family protein [Thermoplasmata archaeon]|nr:YbjQ family protein [Thermoplasmata archaeon]